MFKKCFVTLLFLLCSNVNAQVAVGATEIPVVTNPTFSDDTYVSVPLRFGFPFYGRTFTNSWMHSNGVVSFLDPAAPIGGGANPASWAYCCEGLNLTPGNGALGPQFNYMIAPLWTDLYPVASSTFRTEGTSQYQKYEWNNIAEISSMGNLNTFSLRIRPSGAIDTIYNMINIQNQNVTAGITGDVTQGQMQQFYYGRGIIPGTLGNWSVNETIADLCTSNPLSSPTCPGYAAAYLTQQCTISAVYSPSCPGYAEAYFTQQCTANQLYNTACPGYAAAYLTYQCSINPLYSTTCEGYEQAYFNQQCSLNGLYSRTCPNYAEAYATKMVLEQQGTASIVATAGAVSQTSKTEVSPTVSSDGTVKTEVSKTGDSNVDRAISAPSPTANTAAAPAAVVQLAPRQENRAEPRAAPSPREERREERREQKSDGGAPQQTAKNESSDKEKPKTAREEIQERREAAAKAKAVEEGKNLANNIGQATSMEQQVAVQNVVIQAMGFTPGFDVYHRTLMADAIGYKPFEIYKKQKNVDNVVLGRRLYGPSDVIHEKMVSEQYK